MTYRISYRWHLTGAMMVAALTINVPMATAQLTQQQSQILSGIDKAVEAIDKSPRMKTMSPQAKRQLVEFIVGNTLFVMAHEMGHALINQMDMPVLGREEDAADSFAVVTALKMSSEFSTRVLLEAAKGWVLASKRDKKKGNALAFYDEHGLDLQRAYNVVCFMVGADPEKYKTLAADTKLPEERQKTCAWDYKATAWSWDEMLKKHLRAADQPKVAIKVEYQEDEKYAMQIEILRHMGLLEAFAVHAADRYVWPKPFSIVARSCGVPNARWQNGTLTLTLCYELANYFMELFQGYSSQLPRKYRAAR